MVGQVLYCPYFSVNVWDSSSPKQGGSIGDFSGLGFIALLD